MDLSSIRQYLATVSRPKLVVWSAALGGGGYLGFRIADGLARADFLGQVGAFVAGMIALAIVVALVVIGLVLRLGKASRSTSRATILAGVLVLAGVGVGWAITPALGLGYRAPVELESPGTLTLSLDGVDAYTGRGDTPARCRSVLDASAVALVEADVVGSSGTDPVGAFIVMQADWTDGRPGIVVRVRPAGRADALQPTWRGVSEAAERIDDDRAGRIAFSGAVLVSSPETGRPPGWPAELSGTLSWSCGEWALPGASAPR
jgi:hypothetical protein